MSQGLQASLLAHAARALRALLSPSVLCVLLLCAALACCVAGVHMLAGTGWALIAASGGLFIMAAVLARGLSNG